MDQLFTGFLDVLLGSLYALGLHATFFFALFMLTEKNTTGRYANFRRVDNGERFLGPDVRVDMGYFFLNSLVTVVAGGYVISVVIVTLLQQYVPYHIFAETIEGWPFLLQLLIGVFIADAAFFFPHWFSHKFLWRFHSIHHSAEKLSWTTAVRLHPVDQIPFMVAGAVAMHVLGFDEQVVLLVLVVHNAYNMFVHANLSLDYPKPFCYILGSPNYHRWHHAAEKEAIDKNFATTFPVFDLIFGSYYYPMGRLPASYGLYGGEQKNFPKSFRGQLVYPFRTKKKGKVVRDDGIEPPTHSV